MCGGEAELVGMFVPYSSPRRVFYALCGGCEVTTTLDEREAALERRRAA